MDKLYDKKENVDATMALEQWARSQELTTTDVLYAAMRLSAASFILAQATANVPPDQMVADVAAMQDNMGLIFKAMVRDIIYSVVKAK